MANVWNGLLIAEVGGAGSSSVLFSPRNSVVLVMLVIVVVAGGRRFFHGLAARRAVARLRSADASPGEIALAARYGRAGLEELFGWIAREECPAQRWAAGGALSQLWRRDQLVAEEEKALVIRAFEARWTARRRYPRAMRGMVPIRVLFGVPSLHGVEGGIEAHGLEWSYRVIGSRRARLETPSEWVGGGRDIEFEIDPADFGGREPHRLVLATQVRSVTPLSSRWEAILPQTVFTFEFDPNLARESLLAGEDEAEAVAMGAGIRLRVAEPTDPPRFLALSESWSVRDGIELVIDSGHPRDWVHEIWLELEGISGRMGAGAMVALSRGPGVGAGREVAEGGVMRRVIGEVVGLASDAISGGGMVRARVVLEPDLDRAWAEPGARSVWPGLWVSEWVLVELIRR